LVGIPAILPREIAANFIKPMKISLREQGWIEDRDIGFEIRPAGQ